MESTGRRERKKSRTRSALISVGLRLFEENGFDNTTTQQIAREAKVSQRTLYRYFDTKSDLVLAMHRAWQDEFTHQLEQHRVGETTWTSLVTAGEAALTGLDTQQITDQIRLGHLVGKTPSLLAAFLRNDEYFQEHLASLLLRRHCGENPSSADKLHIRLAVATFHSVDRVASQIWLESDAPLPEDRIKVQRRCTDNLAPALSGSRPAD